MFRLTLHAQMIRPGQPDGISLTILATDEKSKLAHLTNQARWRLQYQLPKDFYVQAA